ncbi:TPA: hypothetical protein ACIICM_004466, partial [Salmonella enterica subsp. enterica serovar Typhimurium]
VNYSSAGGIGIAFHPNIAINRLRIALNSAIQLIKLFVVLFFFENKTCQKQRHGISPVTQYQSNTYQRGFKT